MILMMVIDFIVLIHWLLRLDYKLLSRAITALAALLRVEIVQTAIVRVRRAFSTTNIVIIGDRLELVGEKDGVGADAVVFGALDGALGVDGGVGGGVHDRIILLGRVRGLRRGGHADLLGLDLGEEFFDSAPAHAPIMQFLKQAALLLPG